MQPLGPIEFFRHLHLCGSIKLNHHQLRCNSSLLFYRSGNTQRQVCGEFEPVRLRLCARASRIDFFRHLHWASTAFDGPRDKWGMNTRTGCALVFRCTPCWRLFIMRVVTSFFGYSGRMANLTRSVETFSGAQL